MLRRWRVVAYDVNGREIGEVGRRWTWRGAEKMARSARREIFEPLPGLTLYEIRVVAP